MRTIALPLVVALAVAPLPAGADIAGRPHVVDGRTLEVAGRRVRLHGIDAPDPGQTCRIRGRDYDCGNVARSALMDLVAGVGVRCAPRAERRDGLVVAVCFAAGYDLSEGMVHAGWAMAMPRAGTRYAAIEKRAETARRGLWQGRFLPPWTWRRRHGAAGR